MRGIVVVIAVVVVLASMAASAAPQPFRQSIRPLPPQELSQLRGRYWHAGCPVPLGRLRVLRVSTVGFDGRYQTGQLVVNRDAATPLAPVFRKLYGLRFPVRHMQLSDMYGPVGGRPKDDDVTGSFSAGKRCRRRAPAEAAPGPGRTTPTASRSTSIRARTRTSGAA